MFGNGADSGRRAASLLVGRVKERTGALCLFVFLPRARLRNQSQPAEVALARNCVVSVSHISGVAAAAAAADEKKNVRRNRMKSAAGPRHRTHKHARNRDALIIPSSFFPA